MSKKLLVFFLLIFTTSIFSAEQYFIQKKDELYLISGKKRVFITRDVTNICFPYLLKGKDLYYMVKNDLTRVLLVIQNIDALFAGSFVKGGNLYRLNENRYEFITSGVTKVFNACPPVNYPEIYLPQS
jgi:hypothetical protein